MHAMRMIQAGVTLALCYAATAIVAVAALAFVATATVALGVSSLAKAH